MTSMDLSRMIVLATFILYGLCWSKAVSSPAALDKSLENPRFPQSTIFANFTTVNVSEYDDSTCVASWRQWMSQYWSHYRSIGDIDRILPPGSTVTYTRTQVFASASSYTKCDGIPRVSYLITGSTTWTKTLTYDQVDSYYVRGDLAGVATAAFVSSPLDAVPTPSCSLSAPACEINWMKFRNESLWLVYSFLPRSLNRINVFGCLPPREICEQWGKCRVNPPDFKLIFFQPENATAGDLCATKSSSAYPSTTHHRRSQVENVTTSAVTFWRTEIYLDSITLVTAAETIAGPHTFSPGKVYLAFRNLGAGDVCDWLGPSDKPFVSGILEVPLSDLSTVRYTPRTQFWNGSEVELAKSIAALKILVGNAASGYFRETTVPLNLAHLGGPIPVTDYYFTENLLGPGRQTQMTTMRDDLYSFGLQVPTLLLKSYPAWSACFAEKEVGWDPPLILRPSAQAPRPTAPAWVQGDSTQTDGARSPEMTPAGNARPGSNLVAALATMSQPPSTSEDAQSTARQMLPWQGPIIAATATLIKAVPVVGRPDMIIVGSNILVSDGPQYDMNGETVRFGAHGLVIGSRTLTAPRAVPSNGHRDPIVFEEPKSTASASVSDYSTPRVGRPGLPGDMRVLPESDLAVPSSPPDVPLSADSNLAWAAVDSNVVQSGTTKRSTTSLKTNLAEITGNTAPMRLIASTTSKSESPLPAKAFVSPFFTLGFLVYYLATTV